MSPVWENWSGLPQEREFFIPVTYDPDLAMHLGGHPCVDVDALNEVAAIEGKVPWDYDTLIAAEVIFAGGPGSNGNAMPARIMTTFARANVGETYGLFQNNDPSRNLGGVNEENVYGEDIRDLLVGIRPGDQIGVYVRYNPGWAPQTDIRVFGLRIRYRADPFDSNASP